MVYPLAAKVDLDLARLSVAEREVIAAIWRDGKLLRAYIKDNGEIQITTHELLRVSEPSLEVVLSAVREIVSEREVRLAQEQKRNEERAERERLRAEKPWLLFWRICKRLIARAEHD